MALPTATSYDILGGEIVDLYPVENPTTDLSAEASNELRADVAMMSRMIPRARVKFTGVNGAAPTLVGWEAVWKGADTADPVFERSSEGRFTVSFATSVENERGEEVTLNFQDAFGKAQGSVLRHLQNATPNPNSVSFFTMLADGTVDDCPGTTFVLWIW